MKINFLTVLGLNSRPHVCYTGSLPLEPLHQYCFVLGIFEIGSHKLFALDGLEPQSSRSLLPKWLNPFLNKVEKSQTIMEILDGSKVRNPSKLSKLVNRQFMKGESQIYN
jgi:hypothetical protein